MEKPAARKGDKVHCKKHGDGEIIDGSPHVEIDGQLAARIGDETSFGGNIATGADSITIVDGDVQIVMGNGVRTIDDGKFRMYFNSPCISIGKNTHFGNAFPIPTAEDEAIEPVYPEFMFPPMRVATIMRIGGIIARKSYIKTVSTIGKLDNEWKKQGLALEKRAHKAYQIRHNARLNTREKMPYRKSVKVVQKRDMEKYGNPDGPTFEQLFSNQKTKGLSDSDAYEKIIKSSQKTDSEYDALYGK